MAKSIIVPQYSYDDNTGRYRNISTGRFVTNNDVRAAVDTVIENSKSGILKTALDLQSGAISLAQWQTDTANALKTLHVANGIAGKGGFANMTQADYGYIGSLLKVQYQYLNNFANDLANGGQKLNGTFAARVNLYVQATRGTFEQSKRTRSQEQGFNQERRVLGIADHCVDCTRDANQGWQPIGTLPQIGDSVCKSHCHCSFEYRIVPGQ